jgi:hypothetical protein
LLRSPVLAQFNSPSTACHPVKFLFAIMPVLLFEELEFFDAVFRTINFLVAMLSPLELFSTNGNQGDAKISFFRVTSLQTHAPLQ